MSNYDNYPKRKELNQNPIGDMLDRYFIQPIEAALASRCIEAPEQPINPPEKKTRLAKKSS